MITHSSILIGEYFDARSSGRQPHRKINAAGREGVPLETAVPTSRLRRAGAQGAKPFRCGRRLAARGGVDDGANPAREGPARQERVMIDDPHRHHSGRL
jgi:hypothetical protein